MRFNRLEVFERFCIMMEGAETSDIRYILQGFVDRHAHLTRKCMAIIPSYGFPKKGNHDWQDISRLFQVVGGLDSQVSVIMSHRHSKTIVASSDPDVKFQQRELPNGKHEIVMSMEVNDKISMATDIQTFKWLGGMQQSPFIQMHKIADFVPRCIKCCQTSKSPIPNRQPSLAGAFSLGPAPICNLLPAFSDDWTGFTSSTSKPTISMGNTAMRIRSLCYPDTLPASSVGNAAMLADGGMLLRSLSGPALLPTFSVGDAAMLADGGMLLRSLSGPDASLPGSPASSGFLSSFNFDDDGMLVRSPPLSAISQNLALGFLEPLKTLNPDDFFAITPPRAVIRGPDDDILVISPLIASVEHVKEKRHDIAVNTSPPKPRKPASPKRVMIPIRKLNMKHVI